MKIPKEQIVGFVALLVLLLSTDVFAQPQPVWFRTYDRNRGYDQFNDIYAVSDGGYIACGKTNNDFWVVRTDDNGEVIWDETYGDDGILGVGYSVIETDDDEFLIGGQLGSSFSAVLVNGEGEQTWARNYIIGRCNAVIELKSGEFVLAGSSEDFDQGERKGYFVTINGEGNVIWQREYDGGDGSEFYSIRETEGGIVSAGRYRPENRNESHIWLIKIDFDGDIIWSRFHEIGESNSCFSLASAPDGGFVVTGINQTRELFNNFHHLYMLKVNNNGVMQWTEHYEMFNGMRDVGRCVIRHDDSGFLIVGYSLTLFPRGGVKPVVIRTDLGGGERWRGSYEFEGFDNPFVTVFNSVVTGEDNSLIAAGSGTLELTGADGLIVKIEPEQIGPVELFYSPEDTVLSILPGDTQDFVVRAINQQGIEMDYLWITGEDTLGTDTTVTLDSLVLGNIDLTCLISDWAWTGHVTWHINVTELYISEHEPDTLELSVRRNSTVDFSVEVAAIDGDPIEYMWLHGDDEISDVDSASVTFIQPGLTEISAWAFRGDVWDEVAWQVNVYSALRSWWPWETDLTVRPDTTITFELEPFNPLYDSLSFYWTRDGDSLSSEAEVNVHFVDERRYEVAAWIRDGSEVDSVLWNVEVSIESVGENVENLPSDPVLHNPIPNPFNSQTVIMYDLPFTGRVMLNVYDISGRLIKTLVDGSRTPGNHREVLSADNLSTGIYFVRMTFSDQSFVRKLVVVK